MKQEPIKLLLPTMSQQYKRPKFKQVPLTGEKKKSTRIALEQLLDTFVTWRPISYEVVTTRMFHEGVIKDMYPDHHVRAKVILNMSNRVRLAFDQVYPDLMLHEIRQAFGMMCIEDLIPIINMAINLPKEQCDDRPIE